MGFGQYFPLPGVGQEGPASADLVGPSAEQMLFAKELLTRRQRDALVNSILGEVGQQGEAPPPGQGGAPAEQQMQQETPSNLTADEMAKALAFQQALKGNRDLLYSPDRTTRSYGFGASGILPYAAAMLQKPVLQEQLRQQQEGAKSKAAVAAMKERRAQAESAAKIQESKAHAELYGAQAAAEPQKIKNREKEIDLLGGLRMLREKAAIQTEERDQLRFASDYLGLFKKYMDLEKSTKRDEVIPESLQFLMGLYAKGGPEGQKVMRPKLEEAWQTVIEKTLGDLNMNPKESMTMKAIRQMAKQKVDEIDAALAGAIGGETPQTAPAPEGTLAPEPTPETTPRPKAALPPFQQMIESYGNR
jgi:hypothetical protein